MLTITPPFCMCMSSCGVGTYACVHILCGNQQSMLYFPQLIFILGLSLNMEITDLARLAIQQTPVILVCASLA